MYREEPRISKKNTFGIAVVTYIPQNMNNDSETHNLLLTSWKPNYEI